MLSADEVRDFVDEVANDTAFRDRDLQISYWRKLLFRENDVVIPGIDLSPQSQWRDPVLLNDSHRFKNRMLAAPIKINVSARSTADQAVNRAQKMESVYYRHYYRWRAQKKFDGPLFNQSAFGSGWLYLTLNRDLLPKLPTMKKGQNPEEYAKLCEEPIKAFTSRDLDLFVVEDIQPDTVYYTPGREYVCFKATVPFITAAKHYAKMGKGLNLEGDEIRVETISAGQNVERGDTQSLWKRNVTVYTCADDEYIYHVIDTQSKDKKYAMIGCWPNWFGTPPMFEISGEVTGDPRPQFASLPLIHALYATVPFKNIAQTAKLYAGLDTAQTRYALRKIDPSMPDADPGTLEIRVVDGVLLPPDGYEIVNPGISTGPDLMDAINIINEEQHKYGYPQELGSPSETSAQSGYQQGQQIDVVASLMNPPLEKFAASLQYGIFPAVGNGIKTIGLEQTFRSARAQSVNGRQQDVRELITIKPTDIIDAETTVDFSSLTIFNRIALQEEGMKLMEQGLMHKTEFLREVRDIDDLQAWEMQDETDKIKQFTSERAITDVMAAIDQMRGQWQQDAMLANDVNPLAVADNSLVVNSDMSRPDRGPSIPSGPGAAMPVAPTPPGMGDDSIPVPSGAI